MKLEEATEFLIDWGDDQHLTVHEGLAVAVNVLNAGPVPVQVGTRSSTYMALGAEIPDAWLELFHPAIDPAAVQVDVTYMSRAERGYLTQAMSLGPCERGEHLHASVTLTYMIAVQEGEEAASVQSALYEAWRRVGDQMAELQDRWVHPFLERALDLETLHGGD